MSLSDKLNTPGDYAFFFPGNAGQLEVALSVPVDANTHYVALLGHPHSLQGGTMHNKVVTTMARAFKELGIPCLRFNFRGVGLSEGAYDAGLGESEDMLLLARACVQAQPKATLLFAGFSFGSYVTYRAAAHYPHALLLSVAPSVHHYYYTEFDPKPMPWVVFHGEADEVVPVSLVRDFVANSPDILLVLFPETTHFFHGKLIHLKQQVIDVIKTKVLECQP